MWQGSGQLFLLLLFFLNFGLGVDGLEEFGRIQFNIGRGSIQFTFLLFLFHFIPSNPSRFTSFSPSRPLSSEGEAWNNGSYASDDKMD